VAALALLGAVHAVTRADDAAGVAQRILDDSVPEAERKQLVLDHPRMSVALVRAMVSDLEAGTKEEYRRIPWIWRVTVAAGKRNEAAEIREILDFCLPRPDGPLEDWRAVVIGGGIINGISLTGPWPGARIDEILGDDKPLRARWQRALTLAAEMADDEKIFKGTRYDALRMIALESWDLRGAQLFKYLVKGVDDELQQGAISGLADMPAPSVGQALLSGFAHYSEGNRKFALDALLRDETRTAALLDAVEAGRVTRNDLGAERVDKLLKHENRAIRDRAQKLFP